MEWNREKTLCFIEDYRNLPELWNSRMDAYKDARLKNEGQKLLADKYGCCVVEVKNKIKNLRSAFHRERKKHASGLSPCKSKWFAFEPLSFLRDVEPQTLSMPNLSDGEDAMFQASSPESQKASNHAMGQMAAYNNHHIPFKRPRPNSYKADDYEYDRGQPDTDDRRQDAPDVFGCYVASKLRQMDRQNQMLSERLISEVLFRGQMGLLTTNSAFNNEEVTTPTVKVED